jgi:transcriptional regulator of nitric oxide reductase
MSWRVTHVDHAQRRRQVELQCEGRTAAETVTVLMYGAPTYMAAVRVADGLPPAPQACPCLAEFERCVELAAKVRKLRSWAAQIRAGGKTYVMTLGQIEAAARSCEAELRAAADTALSQSEPCTGACKRYGTCRCDERVAS